MPNVDYLDALIKHGPTLFSDLAVLRQKISSETDNAKAMHMVLVDLVPQIEKLISVMSVPLESYAPPQPSVQPVELEWERVPFGFKIEGSTD